MTYLCRPNLRPDMMRKQGITFSNNVLETFEFDRPLTWEVVEGAYCYVHSYDYYCPVCQNIWAKSRIAGEALVYPIVQPCSLHRLSRYHVSGSLLVRSSLNGFPHDPILLDYLPEVLVRRELHLHEAHMTFWENKND